MFKDIPVQEFIRSFSLKVMDTMPMVLAKLIGIIILIVIWPKIVHYITEGIEKIMLRKKVEALLSSFVSSAMKIIMYIVLFFIIIGILGIEATSLLTVLGTAGLAIGLALQGSLTNLAGGMLLLFFRPFIKGDYIVSGSNEGTVDRIQILYTTLITPDNRVVIIPNGQLANNAVTNVTKNPIRRLDLVFSVSYDTSIQQVKTLLTKLASEHKNVLKDKPINVRLNVQNASSLDFIFRVWVKKEDYWDTKFDFMELVKEEFDNVDIEIPYNKLDVYTKN